MVESQGMPERSGWRERLLEPEAAAPLILDVGVRLCTASMIDGRFGMPPAVAMDISACMVGVAYSDAIANLLRHAAEDPAKAATYISATMAEVVGRLEAAQADAATRQAVALASAFGLTH